MIGIERKTEVLGSGAYSTVSAEWDPLLGHAVAVKELNSPFAQNDAFARAFLAKAERLFDLEHEHVLEIYRVDVSRQAPAFVREIADDTLEAAAFAGPLPPARVGEILRQALLGLRAMHARGVIHGAVKPRNLFQCGDRVKIGDFGMTGIPGAPPAAVSPHVAPELLRGEAASPASDLYALGIAAYELLLGRTRFEQISRLDLPLLDELMPGIPRTLSLAVEQMTRKAVAYRAADADQALAALGALEPAGTRVSSPFSVTGTSALDARLRPEAPKPRLDLQKLKRVTAIAMAALLVILGVSAALFLRNQRPESSGAAPKPAPSKPGTTVQPNGPAAAQGSQTAVPPTPPPAPGSGQTAAGSPSVPTAPPRTPDRPAPPRPQTASKEPAPVSAAKPQVSGLQPTNQNVEETPSQAPEEAPAKRMPSAREIIQGLQPSRYALGALHGGQRAYVDLDAVYADVPWQRDRIPCIETAVADREGQETLSFELSRDARVFVGHDRSIKRKPAWLQAFHQTGETWSVLIRNAGDAGSAVIYFDVFTRSYPAGTVSLGPNMGQGLFSRFKTLGKQLLGRGEPSMYLVCVDPR